MALKDRMKPLILTKKEEVGFPGLAVFHFKPTDGPIVDFEAGQYLTIGDDVQQAAGVKFVPRPYSVASSPLVKDSVEFYIVEVDGGEFTPHLFRKKIGEQVWYMGPKGKFTLSRTALTRMVFMCTGTGLAPFISMLRTLKTSGQGRGKTITLMFGNRTSKEMGYVEELRGCEVDADLDFVYLPTVSRPDGDAGWSPAMGKGRVNDTFRLLLGLPKQGKVDPVLPAHQTRDALVARMPKGQTAFFLCGNPDMIADAKAAITAQGWTAPEHIFTEDYW
ncbi:MAG: hypothetical protein A3G34_02740 [Candidatus Lindowbacteria bacterium RIFCSPLOWO2_12_FULL_62_27]|nr:MAG: hypothetical protein A3G34_02740 [Candidatus Lindowbacteria bacterium RIFCSPLOWO2_12_FULL_62_27]OGH63356.1 MAG: hypothetical protein A3I06_08985 [Candidatus Lindowbacteria bacterium RIFCSPLOWO2_02_FULL_62_12]